MNEKLNMNVRILIGESLSIDDLNVLSLLYMPIIGNRAYTIYMTLYSALNRSSNTRVVLVSDIVDLFGIKIATFELERKRLEAIGLMATYFKDNEYVFLLKAPLSARHFFNDCILGAYLKNKVGEVLFNKLVNLFRLESFNKEGYKNITEVFENVFRDNIDETIEKQDGYLMDKQINSSIKTGKFEFDYDYFLTSLNLGIAKKNSLSAEFQTIVEKTAYMFNLNEEEMVVVYHRSLDQAGNFAITRLQKEAKSFKKRKENESKSEGVVGDDRIRYMDPKAILKLMRPEASIEDYNVIEKVANDSPFNSEITNVAILHGIKKNKNEFLEAGYFFKVFQTFEKYNIKSFEDALRFVMAQGNYDENEAKKVSTKRNIEQQPEKKIVRKSEWLKNFLDESSKED